MTTKTKHVPALRFPGFGEEWVYKKFGDIYSFRTTNSLSREHLNYDSGEVKNIHYGDIHTKFNTHFDIEKEQVPFINDDVSLSKMSPDNFCKEGDLVIADASEDYADIGKSIEIIKLGKYKVLAGLHTLLARPVSNLMYVGFCGHLMKSDSVRLQIKTIAQGTKVLSISTGRLSQINITIPTLPEQQKIASFLTAIDTKINQLTRKKQLLEQYKKGVMQKIFNQEIRFKDDNGGEFPEWEEKMLGEIGVIITGKTPSTSDADLWGGEIQFVTPTDMQGGKYQTSTERTVTNTHRIKLLPIKSILFTCIASIGKMSMSIKPCITNQQINSIVPSSNFDNEFIYYSLLNIVDFIKSTQSTTTLPIINKTEFSKFSIQVPISIAEQQKIATFLTAIDTKITQTTQQLEQSQAYKKGLLQQMFV